MYHKRHHSDSRHLYQQQIVQLLQGLAQQQEGCVGASNWTCAEGGGTAVWTRTVVTGAVAACVVAAAVHYSMLHLQALALAEEVMTVPLLKTHSVACDCRVDGAACCCMYQHSWLTACVLSW